MAHKMDLSKYHNVQHSAVLDISAQEKTGEKMRCSQGVLSVLAVCLLMPAQAVQSTGNQSVGDVAHMKEFQVIEFRRYTIKEGEREHFALFFESFFPEAFEQLGAIAAGSFFERQNRAGFTWLRAFHTLDDRAVVNASFYYGPVWKEHKKRMNDLMTDSDNVLLLHPISPERGIAVLPPVDPVAESGGAQGVVVAQVFAVKPESVGAFAREAEAAFAAYRAAGAREAGVLATLDVPNNFPQLPVRGDGPYLVWLGILKDNQTLEASFTPVVERSLPALSGTGLLRRTPELIVLDPTHRSRLRWLP